MADLLFLIQWTTILLSLVGLFYILNVIRFIRMIRFDLIKARVFLNDRFLLHLMYLLAAICFLFIVHALSEYISMYNMELFGFTLTKLIKESTELGVLICAVWMGRLWYGLLSGITK